MRMIQNARRALPGAAIALLVLAISIAPLPAKIGKHHDHDRYDEQAELLAEASAVLKAAVRAPDKRIPRRLLERAECVGVFPGLKKGAFVVGGEYGRGVFTCRDASGRMSAPAFFKMGGPSVGWQFGGSSTDIVLLVMNQKGMRHLLQDKFTLGGQASVAAGPVGRNARAATDLQLRAQILSWSRTRGAFLGWSVEGMVVRHDRESIEELYGRPLTARDLLIDHRARVPAPARAFVATANQWTRRT